MASPATNHGPGIPFRSPLAHEVDDDIGSGPIGELHYLTDLLAIHYDEFVRPQLFCELQGFRGGIDHDYSRCGQSLEALQPDVSETAGSQDDGSRSRGQHWSRLADGMVGGEASVSVRGDISRFEAGRQLDQGSSVGLQVLGHTAFVRHAGELAVQAMHVVTLPARWAQAARSEGMNDNRIAYLDICHGRADLLDPPGAFVPKCVWEFNFDLLRPLSLDDVQVSSAQSRPTNADDDIERSAHRRPRNVVDDWRLAVCV
jgi:hypothetical protein